MNGRIIAKVAESLISAGFEIDKIEDEKEYPFNNEKPRYTGAIELRIKEAKDKGADHE
jgi:ribosomal protein S11